VLGPALFTLGAAIGHVQQMVTAHNFAPGNAGLLAFGGRLSSGPAIRPASGG
jgi:hypothetical protein